MNNNNKPTSPVVFYCSNCRTILADSLSFIETIEEISSVAFSGG